MTKVGALKKVDCLIIDEASQGSELDTIIPFVNFDVKKVILVGDHLQMSPTVFSEFSRRNMYEQSLFERIHHSFQKQGRESFLLDTQYRMHPEVASFPTRYVYDGK